MVQTLEGILGNMQSDQNKLNFLNRIYTPGNTEVADAILALNPNNFEVIKSELEYSRVEGLVERFDLFARKFIDLYIAEDLDILLKDKVISWGDKGLADYAISKFREKDCQNSLEYAAELAMKFGRENEGRQIMERLFDVQMESLGQEYPFSPAMTAVKLGRFEEAINLYIKSGYHWLDTAMRIAREHSPERVTEIANLGFYGYDSGANHRPELYLESARILGKEEKARKVLKQEANKLKINNSPRYYTDLVSALVSLGLTDEARSVADQIEDYEIKQMQTKKYYDGNNQREVADIFLVLGDKERAVKAYIRKIDKELPEYNQSNFMPDIDKVYELTGDKSVLQKKFFVFEKEGQYDKAAELARNLGNTDLAETYDHMQKMVSTVKTPAQ